MEIFLGLQFDGKSPEILKTDGYREEWTLGKVLEVLCFEGIAWENRGLLFKKGSSFNKKIRIKSCSNYRREIQKSFLPSKVHMKKSQQRKTSQRFDQMK